MKMDPPFLKAEDSRSEAPPAVLVIRLFPFCPCELVFSNVLHMGSDALHWLLEGASVKVSGHPKL